MDNLQVDNYHGLGYRIYGVKDCATDQGLKRITLEDRKPVLHLDFDLLCLDESQDTTPVIYAFNRKIIRDNKSAAKNIQHIVLGDPRQVLSKTTCLHHLTVYSQEIYTYNYADKHFLTMANSAFPSTRDWTRIEHRTSYRAPIPHVEFINRQLLNPRDTPFIGVKQGPRPCHLLCDSKSDTPLRELLRYVGLLDPSKILVTSPSIRSKQTPVRSLANRLAIQRPDISCYIPASDEEELSSTFSEGKLLFCTYHQAKGIQREAVIMFGFDTSYYKFYARDEDQSTISNAQYVGVTRSSQHLTVIHDVHNDFLPFLDQSTLPEHCEMVIQRPPTADPKGPEKQNGHYAVTDLTRHVPEAVMSHCFNGFFSLTLERPAAKHRVYPPTEITLENGLREGVADITGSAIPAIFEFRSRGTCTLLQKVQKELRDNIKNSSPTTKDKEFEHPFRHLPPELSARLLGFRPETMTLADFLLVANAWNASTSRYIHKLLKIKRYDWLEEKHVAPAMEVLRKLISSRARYEQDVRGPVNVSTPAGPSIHGQIDVIDGLIVWEVKWTDSSRPEHALQLACYAGLDSRRNPQRIYKLLHVPTGQIVVMHQTGEDGYQRLLEKLVRVRAQGNRGLGLTDGAFREELEREFRGFLSGLNIPVWLNS